MIINISDVTIVPPKKGREEMGPSIRFSITFYTRKKKPIITIEGWLMARDRVVRPPQTRTFRGGFYSFTKPALWFLDDIRAKLDSMPAVIHTLGPPPEPDETIEGEFTVLRENDE